MSFTDFDQKFCPGSMNVLGKLISPQPPTNVMFLMNQLVPFSVNSEKLAGREIWSLVCQSHKDHKDVNSSLFSGGVCTMQLES